MLKCDCIALHTFKIMKLDKYLGKGTKQGEGLSEKKANLGTAAGNQEDFLVVVAFK